MEGAAVLVRAICSISLLSVAVAPAAAAQDLSAATSGAGSSVAGHLAWAPAEQVRTAAPRAVATIEKRKPKRRGGKVREAWPANRRAPRPRNRLARWLARQVGPVPTRSARSAAAEDHGALL